MLEDIKQKIIKASNAKNHICIVASKLNNGAENTSKFFVQCLGLNDSIKGLKNNNNSKNIYILNLSI